MVIYTELHIKDNLNRLIEVINIRNKITFNNINYITTKDAYLELVYCLNNYMDNNYINKLSKDVILDILIEDLCNSITILNKFKYKVNYKVYINYYEA
jgi:hypothetical protein